VRLVFISISSCLPCPFSEGLLGVPARRDARNLSGDPPILRLPPQTSHGGWLVEEDVSRGHLNNRGSLLAQEPDASKADKPRVHQSLLSHSMVPSVPLPHLSRGRAEEVDFLSFIITFC